MKRRVATALSALILSVGLMGCALAEGEDGSSLAIIGGADGPTSIFLGPGSTEKDISTEAASETEGNTESEESKAEVEETVSETEQLYTEADLKSLKNTEIFLPSAIEHIFIGSINKKGNATGYHYEGIEDSLGEVIEGTRSKPDSFGVYSGKIRINGINKSGNKGYSTFYPEDMSPQEVIDAIGEAYESRELLSGNLYAGLTEEGMEIDMALTDDDKIITAYPVMED